MFQVQELRTTGVSWPPLHIPKPGTRFGLGSVSARFGDVPGMGYFGDGLDGVGMFGDGLKMVWAWLGQLLGMFWIRFGNVWKLSC